MSTTHISCADTAKLIRAALKQEFPCAKFSVRSSTYSMGASINVSWTDGPTTAAVDKIAGKYSGASFDGMIDLKSYHSSWLRDENGDAQEVHFGADYVFCNRTISPEWTARILAEFSRVSGVELDPEDRGVWQIQVPLAVDRWNGGRLLHMVESDREDVSTVFHQFTSWRQGGSLEAFAEAL